MVAEASGYFIDVVLMKTELKYVCIKIYFNWPLTTLKDRVKTLTILFRGGNAKVKKHRNRGIETFKIFVFYNHTFQPKEMLFTFLLLRC